MKKKSYDGDGIGLDKVYEQFAEEEEVIIEVEAIDSSRLSKEEVKQIRLREEQERINNLGRRK